MLKIKTRRRVHVHIYQQSSIPFSFISSKDYEPTSNQANTVAQAFDDVDTANQGTIPANQCEQLLDKVGEGFHGNDFDKQVNILVLPAVAKYLGRHSSVGIASLWKVVTMAIAGDSEYRDGGESLDTEDREEREEERAKAIEAFTETAEGGVVTRTNFKDLMEAMGTTYCKVEHRRTIKKISDVNGNIQQDAIVDWYVDWIFGGDGDESDYDSDAGSDGDDVDRSETGRADSSAGGSNNAG